VLKFPVMAVSDARPGAAPGRDPSAAAAFGAGATRPV
jgi:hypothetical protein